MNVWGRGDKAGYVGAVEQWNNADCLKTSKSNMEQA